MEEAASGGRLGVRRGPIRGPVDIDRVRPLMSERSHDNRIVPIVPR